MNPESSTNDIRDNTKNIVWGLGIGVILIIIGLYIYNNATPFKDDTMRGRSALVTAIIKIVWSKGGGIGTGVIGLLFIWGALSNIIKPPKSNYRGPPCPECGKLLVDDESDFCMNCNQQLVIVKDEKTGERRHVAKGPVG